MSAELACFGPPSERRRVWILKFEDADVADMYFNDEKEAHARYEQLSMSWNCTLLETAERKFEWVRGELHPLR